MKTDGAVAVGGVAISARRRPRRSQRIVGCAEVDQGARAGARAGRRGQKGGAAAGAGEEGVLRCLLGRSPLLSRSSISRGNARREAPRRAHDAAAMASGWRPLDDIDAGRRRGATRGSTTPSPRPRNYKLLRNLPLVFPVVAQDPRKAEEPCQSVVRRVPNHRRRVGPLAPGSRRLVFG